MKSTTRKRVDRVIAVTTLFCMTAQGAFGAYLDLADQPLFIGANVPPQVMLTISKEQQLYKKAYNDYSDLDEDGKIETTYSHAIDYYGYFDSYKCYSYDAAGQLFVPVKDNSAARNIETDDNGKPTTAAIEDNKKAKYCESGAKQWSGNFLNWVSMSRMDTVRKLLYGGMRSTDGPAVAGVSTTVLERAHLPTDAHSWAKYYNGTDIATLTPFDPPTATKPFAATTAQMITFCPFTAVNFGFPTGVYTQPTPPPSGPVPFVIPPRVLTPCPVPLPSGGDGSPLLPPPNPPVQTPSVPLSSLPQGGDVDITFTTAMNTELSRGDQVRFEIAATSRGPSIADCSGAVTPCMIGVVQGFSNANQTVRVRVNPGGTPGSVLIPGSGFTLQVTNLSRTGISFCNVTFPKVGNKLSHLNQDLPLIRAAQGNFHLWNANERFQCMWRSEWALPAGSLFPGPGANGNQAALSEIYASADNPSQPEHALPGGDNGEFVARVAACVSGLFGTERCKQYPSGNYKPIGLLQEYGDVDLIQFGLMTGSYARNISGGVLRKNVGTFTDEVNVTTDGTFKAPAVPPGSPRGTTSAATPPGIVNTLNYVKIFGYNYVDGLYNVTDSCPFQLTNITQGACTSWGNPMSEIYFESLRYFAGGTPTVATVPQPTAAFTYASDLGSKDNQLGLPLPVWKDPLTKNNYCSPLNVLVFNASVSTNDDDLRNVSAASINSAKTPRELTNIVGDAEGITYDAVKNNVGFFAGKLIGAAPTPATDVGFELCTAKNIPGLGDVSGICPEGPTLAGSYLMAGLAHHARTNRLRTDIAIPSNDAKSLKVTTYGIQLATNVPTIVLPVPGSTTQKVIIQPITRLLAAGGGLGGGALVDLKFVRQETTAGSNKGKVYINWEDSEQGGDYDQDMWGTLEWELTGSSIKITTHVLSESTNRPMGFGYSISGTKQDGPHFHSGISGTTGLPGFSFADPTGGPTCTNCQVLDSGGVPTTRVYELGTSTGKTLQDPMWYAAKYGAFVDSNGNGIPDLQSEWDSKFANGQTAPNGDGNPDTYFLVINPLGLVAALNRAFVAILSNASASSVATNSTSLQTGTTIYQARFNANDWSGQVLAFKVDDKGQIAKDPTWDAGQIVNAQSPLDTASPPAKAVISTDPDVIKGSGRTIITYNTGSQQGVPFRWPANPASLQTTDIPKALVDNLNLGTTGTNPPPDGRGKQRLEWMRGSQANEGAGVNAFRVRPISRLGDIVNSNPNFVAAPSSGFGDELYNKFRQDNLNRKAMIYVGGNDGMLHAFRADDGREVLAYVPSMVHNRLNKLTDKTYVGGEHRYYVDGSPEIGDAFINVGGTDAWHTVLVGSLGGGGQGVFALDITKPDDFSETNAAKIALWEFTDKDDPDLGFIYAQPTIRRMANGRFAALVPGGYNQSKPQPGEVVCADSTKPASDPARGPAGCTTNTTGSAYLFIIFLDGPGSDGVWEEGKDYVKIRAAQLGDTPGTPNGLTQPLAADVDADGFVDFIYAGDLRGNLWKFDVRLQPHSKSVPPADPIKPPFPSDQSISGWTSGDNRLILFVAKDASGATQPITGKPEATLHPIDGFIVTFGTGKYIERNDPFPPGGPPPTPPTPYQAQSFYGIWDKNDARPIAKASVDESLAPTPVQTWVETRDQLLPHEIRTADSNSAIRVIVPIVVGKVKPTDPDTLLDTPLWSEDKTPPTADDAPKDSPLSTGKHLGWRLDFPSAASTGERSVFRPILTSGRLIFTTLLPLTEACQSGGTSFTMVIDPTSGGRIDAPVLDTNANGLLNDKDVVTSGTFKDIFASGLQSTIGITPTPTIIRAGSLPPDTASTGSKILGTSGPLVAASGALLAYALSAGSSGGNASTVIGLSAAGGRVSWRELTAE